jgi:hypothetical protein
MKRWRYSERDWKSAKNIATRKANTVTAATENKIESKGMITSSDAFFVVSQESQPHLHAALQYLLSAMIRIKGSVALIELDEPSLPPFVRFGGSVSTMLAGASSDRERD